MPLRHRFAGDARDLEEMLGNLLDNACKWARRRIGVASRLEGDRLLLSVEDDGPGVPAERRDSIFEGDSTRVGGTGVGLRHARDLARSLGGDLMLLISPRSGASFRPRDRATPNRF